MIALAGLAAGCTASVARPVRVGVAGPWSLEYTAMTRRGIQLAVDEVNAAGGAGGRRLQIVQKDDAAQGARAAAVAAELAADPRVVAVVGHLNSGAMVSAARVYDGRVAAVSPIATSPDLTGISPWVFRVVASDSASGSALARSGVARRARRVAVLYENNVYGRGLAAAFERELGASLLGIDPIAESGVGVEPLVAYYKQERADLVFVAGTRESGVAVLREARRQGLAATFLGGDGWAQIPADTLASEGAYVGLPFALGDDDPDRQRFVRAFTARHGMAPDASAALAYDATMAVAGAIAEGGADRARVRAALAAGSGAREGVTGILRFRPDGDPVERSTTLMRVRRGALVRVAAGE